MRSRRLLFLLVLALAVVLPAAAFAQAVNVTSGSINGRVLDSSQAVLPGVSVTATGLETGLVRTVVSDRAGEYTMTLLPPGHYRVEAALSGLGKTTVADANVLLGNSTRVDLVITPQLTETVTVTEPIVDASRTGTAMSVTSAQISSLPLLGRDFKSLAAMSPGIGDAFGGRVTANGARGIGTDYNIDGATSNNDFFGENTGGTRAPFTFSQAAIREFQVVRSQYDAEFGRGIGAQINAITKSGSNALHGETFVFMRKRDWASVRPKTLPDGTVVVDSFRAKDSTQGGFAVGGPIVKNNVFFFGNYDSQRQKLPTVVTSTDVRLIPNFTNLPAATQQAFFDKLLVIEGGPYPDQLVYDQTFNQNTYLFKVDGNLGNSTRLSVRDNYTNFENANNQTPRNRSNQGTEHDKFNQLVGQATTMVSARMVNEALVEYSTDERPITSHLKGAEVSVSGITNSGIFYGKNDGFPNNTKERKIQIKDAFRVTLGGHSIKFGGEGIFMHIDNLFARNFDGLYSYNTVQDFVSDKPNTFAQGYGFGNGLTSWDQDTYALFVTDNFRPTARLTLDLGLRYDTQTMPLPPGNFFPQHPEFITNIHQDKNNVAPRLGAAYDIKGDGKSVIRGGVGKFFGYMPNILLSNPLTQISGNFLAYSLTCATATTVKCPTYPDKLTGDQINLLTAGAVTNIVTISPTYQAQEAWRSNVEFERQLSRSLSASVGGVYSKMSKVQGSANINAVPTGIVLGDLPVYDIVAKAVYADLSVVRELCSCEEAWYKALTLELHSHNFSKWVPLFDANYTYGSAVDQDTNERSTSSSFLFDPRNPALSQGPSDNDVRHRFSANATYRLPWYGF